MHHSAQLLRRLNPHLTSPSEQMLGDLAQAARAEAHHDLVTILLDLLMRVKSPSAGTFCACAGSPSALSPSALTSVSRRSSFALRAMVVFSPRS